MRIIEKTVFQILFRISQSNGSKNENSKPDIAALKPVFGFRVRLQIRNPDFKFKFGFPNPTHPKESCFLVRCLLESKLSRNHFRAAKELDRNLRNTALTVHAFPSRERAPCSFFGSLVAWTFPRGCKKKRFLTESEKFRSNYESYLSIT